MLRTPTKFEATTHANLTGLQSPIDRRAVVSRHNVTRRTLDAKAPLQVGNGQFAFSADITGLQTFVPFNTMSEWGWHSFPLPAGELPSDFRGTAWDSHGRRVMYSSPNDEQAELGRWMYQNPHRINLARIGLSLTTESGREATPDDIGDALQTLDLWTGSLRSEFTLEGEQVVVETCAAQDMDAIAIRIQSALISFDRLSLFIDFPYANLTELSQYVGDFDQGDKHETTVDQKTQNRVDITHTLDASSYQTSVEWQHHGEFKRSRSGGSSDSHRFTLSGRSDQLDAIIAFAPDATPGTLPTVDDTLVSSAKHWEAYWLSGAAIDLSDSKDSRWRELERRIVLSQYVMRVNEVGSQPPQESGLVNNGWMGKFHMEMYWWHAAHWALWNRWPELDCSTGIYETFLPTSRLRAENQGCRGARWPKMTTREGWESVHPCNATVIWQQPHPMFFAELEYRARPTRETLLKWKDVLFETADFMASYAFWDESIKQFVLGPPMYVVSENTDPTITVNPAFELSYWRFGLRIAQTWRERLGLARNDAWENVQANLAPLPIEDGVYVLYEGVDDMWTNYAFEHPALTGVYGWLPGDGVDVEVERRTVDRVFATWNMKHVWGWDLPMMAMCMARLGDPSKAVGLLVDANTQFDFDDAGLSTGGPHPYFPSNGGLLYAVAMMSAGWDGAPAVHAPGFPQDGSWTVRWEGLSPAL
ncbi:MAG TPA: hypothetical protein VGK19_03210 [Capsulimonadaceae bacterium]|jgi:hypothetical protein